MLTAERKNLILDALQAEGTLKASDLSKRFGVSEDTVRRDLRDLASAGLLQRVHGGALPRSPVSVQYADREQQSPESKRRIAAAAAGLLRPGECVVIDSGTTPLAVAEALSADTEFDVVTHSLPVALALANHRAATVTVVGGRFFKSARATIGTTTVDAYRQLRPDTAILGAAGVEVAAGLTTFNQEDAHVKRAFLENARRVIAVIASEKLGTVAPHFILSTAKLTHLITDSAATPATLDPFRAAGIDIILA